MGRGKRIYGDDETLCAAGMAVAEQMGREKACELTVAGRQSYLYLEATIVSLVRNGDE